MEFILSELREQVMTARASQRPLCIRGGGTKNFYGEAVGADHVSDSAVLDISGYTGVINYQPAELVITARAGTLLSEIEQTLDEQGQMLAFEPPRFGPASTIGGCVASGLSGPRRMYAGSVRDFVLGTRLLDSGGTELRFGGEVMKNVAGYDMSRVLTGSLGIFGALTEVSIKVAPKPFEEATLVLECDQAAALAMFRQWRSRPLPISATAWVSISGRPNDGRLYVRLSGSEPAVDSAVKHIGGQSLPSPGDQEFWTSLRDQTHSFFQARPLWRVSVPPDSRPMDAGPTLIEWNGGLRWIAGTDDGAGLRANVAGLGGHATLYRYTSKPEGLPIFHPLEANLMSINRRLKQEMDPVGIFNPKRLFAEF